MLRIAIGSVVSSVFAVAVVAGVLATTAAPTNAMAPIKIGPGDLPPDVFPAINPCTGDEQIVTVAPNKGTIHEFVTPSGNSHFVLSLHQGVITASDGFNGKVGAFRLVENTDTDHGIFSGVNNQLLSNGDGLKFTIHVVAHVTFANGSLVVEFEKFSAECIGNHNGT